MSLLLIASPLYASPPGWVFNPAKVGNVLLEGGWSLSYSLGEINASPEFNFPLQLVYLTIRDSKGLFGNQWFCPQLESSLIPEGTGFLLWTMPSGGRVGLKVNPARPDEFISPDGQWRATRIGLNYLLTNGEGWKFYYSKGVLGTVASPTGRLLEFQGTAGQQFTLILRDPMSGGERILLTLGSGQNRCASLLRINGQTHQFGYIADGTSEHLTGWRPPLGNPLRFYYQPENGVLYHVETLSGEKVADAADFKSFFVPPHEGNKPSAESLPAKHPKNYWLQSDSLFDYTYARDSKNDRRFLTGQVKATSKTGLVLETVQSTERGIITSREGGAETKSYFYVAPGQKYNGKLRRVEKDGGLQVEYRYDHKTGLLSEAVDGGGIITFFEYPESGSPELAPLLEPKPIRILRGSRAKKEILAEYGYNESGQMVVAKDAAGQITRYTYTPRGELQSVTGPDGGTTTFTYDGFGHRISVAQGKLKESVEFDEAGRVKSRTSSDGIRTEFTRNTQDQIASITKGGKPVVEYLYDGEGKLLGERDPLGRVRNIERDLKGNLLSETAPNGSITRYEYDGLNRRTAQIDGNGNKISFEYDPAGHLVKQVNPLGQTLSWTYDPQGHLTNRSNGEQNIAYTYDDAGRLTQLDFGKQGGEQQIISYQYDAQGKLRSASTPETRSELSYDTLGHIQAIQLAQGEGGKEQTLLRYRYNARGQRTGLIIAKITLAVPSHGDIAGKSAAVEPIQQTEYTYDISGRLTSILSNGAPIVSYQYDTTGRPVQKSFRNGTEVSLSYDAAGRLAGEHFSGSALSSSLDLIYQWDSASQLISRTWNGQTLAYGYDPSGQLLSVTDTQSRSPLESYSYDKAGNMTRKVIAGKTTSMTYDGANQLVASSEGTNAPMAQRSEVSRNGCEATAGQASQSSEVSAVATSLPTSTPPALASAFTYDKAGRLIHTPGGPIRSYGWLDKVVNLTTPSGESIHYSYWPDGQLAAKQSLSSSQECFLWDGLALIRRNDTLYIIEPHPSGGVPIASHPVGKPDELTWYLNDMLGSTLATVDQSGVHFQNMTSFGQPLKLAAEVPKPTALRGDLSAPNPVPSIPTLPSKL